MTGSSGKAFNMQTGCGIFFALFWTAFASIFVILGLTTGELAPFLIGSLFVLIGLALLGWFLLSLFTRYLVGQPKLEISNQTLRVGEPFTVSYAHTFPRAITLEFIRTQLIFRETATYQRGTKTKTVTHERVIDEFEEPGTSYRARAKIRQTYNFRIPPDGMHSLKVRRNKLEWFITFQMGVAKLPDFKDEYELDVLPELMR